jgi:hypothetical protein
MLSAVAVCRRASSTSNSVFETKMEVNRFVRRPIVSVIAKPRIGPVPNWNRNIAEMSDAMCVSSSVRKTRENPVLMAARTPRYAASSSLIRSKMSTFESTPIPMVSTKPAIPGSVIVAPMYAISPSRMTRFMTSAMTAFTPDSL